MSNTSTPKKQSNSNCHHWIAVAAYFLSEARGFEPGKELDDWLQAEIEYTKFQIKSFFLRCEEDGGITIAGLQGLGRHLGVDHPETINTEKKLIREIQKISKHYPCFQSQPDENCEETDCLWREECQKLIADWFR